MSIEKNQLSVYSPDSSSFNNRLPDDIIGVIAGFLPPQGYGSMVAVCKTWKDGCQGVVFSRQDLKNLDLVKFFEVLESQSPYSNHRSLNKFCAWLQKIPETSQLNKQTAEQVAVYIRSAICTLREQDRDVFRRWEFRGDGLDLSSQGLTELSPEIRVASLDPISHPLAELDVVYVNLRNNRFTNLQFINALPPTVQIVEFEENPLNYSLKTTLFFQKTLHVLSVAAAIISVIPPLRSIGSLVLRSLSCISSTLICKNSLEYDDKFTCVLKCIKIGTSILGLVGFIMGHPQLIMIALGIDIALQCIEFIQGVRGENIAKCLMYVGFIILNSLVLASLATGMWQIIVAASGWSVCMMLIIAFYSGPNGGLLECICNILLFGTSLASAVLSAEVSRPDRYYYDFTNTTNDKVKLWDLGHHVWWVSPGETVHVDTDRNFIKETLPFGETYKINPVSSDITIIQAAIPAVQLPTVPVGSPFIENTFIPFKPWVRR